MDQGGAGGIAGGQVPEACAPTPPAQERIAPSGLKAKSVTRPLCRIVGKRGVPPIASQTWISSSSQMVTMDRPSGLRRGSGDAEAGQETRKRDRREAGEAGQVRYC